MKTAILALACLSLAGCTAARAPDAGPDFTPSYSRLPLANTAPRGTEEFCRIYGQQSANNRAQASGPSGRGPRGFDRTLARSEGERAYARCLAGRR